MVLSGAVAVVSAAAVTSVFIGLAIRSEMIDNADEVGEVRAEQVADLAQRGILPREIDRADDLEAAVQVVQRGMVLSSTSNASDPAFFDLPTQRPGVDKVYGLGHLPIDDDGPFRVTALGARTPHGNVTVLVAVDVGDVDEVLASPCQQGRPRPECAPGDLRNRPVAGGRADHEVGGGHPETCGGHHRAALEPTRP